MVIGHQRQINYLSRVLKRGTLAHAYLFHGPEAVGKKTVALEFARALLCRVSPKALGGCGQCQDCRQVEAASHPDLLMLGRERLLVPEELKREIGIQNIHELQRLLAFSSWRGGRKVAIIDGAEDLSHDAQTALLKILEEPDERTCFLLITPAAEALLPTVRSRSVAIGFTTVGGDEIQPLLASVAKARRSSLLAWAEGRPGVLMRLIQDKKFFEEFRASRARLKEILSAGLGQQFVFSEKNAREPGMLEALLEFMIRKLSGELYASLHFVECGVHAALDGSPARAATGEDNRLLALASLLTTLLQKLYLVETTAVNRRLLCDSVFFDLHLLSPSSSSA